MKNGTEGRFLVLCSFEARTTSRAGDVSARHNALSAKGFSYS
jgi:hypothetical protein